MALTVQESLMKFNLWRQQQYAQVIQASAQDEQRIQALLRIDAQWQMLFSGREGYTRILSMSKNGGETSFLADKKAIAEKGLLDAGQRYLVEFERLGLKPV
jgi:hypothetical protein